MIDIPQTLPSVAQAIIVIAAVITSLYVIARCIRGGYRFVKRLDLIHSTILEELLPNGGSSIKDQISRIDSRLAEVERREADRRHA